MIAKVPYGCYDTMDYDVTNLFGQNSKYVQAGTGNVTIRMAMTQTGPGGILSWGLKAEQLILIVKS